MADFFNTISFVFFGVMLIALLGTGIFAVIDNSRSKNQIVEVKRMSAKKKSRICALIALGCLALVILCTILNSVITDKEQKDAEAKAAKLRQEMYESGYTPAKPFTEKAEERITFAIRAYKDKCELISVGFNTDFGINIIMNCYDPYVFAQIIKASTDEAKIIVAEKEIEEYHLSVMTPSNSSQKLFWYSTDLNSGLFSDNGVDVKLTVDEIAERYSSETESTSEVPKTYVYVAASGNGKKYHRKKSCSGMNGNATSITLEQAKSQGYSACKICY